jgi:hypothetical protein
MSQICSKLSGTAFTWGKLVAPWAEYVAQTLWAGCKSRRTGNSVPPTRLTQQRRTEAKGKVWIGKVEPPKTDHSCRGCGKTIANESTHCAGCAVEAATKRLISAASLGRVAARSPEARAKRGATRRKHAKACSEWDALTQPAWITDQSTPRKSSLSYGKCQPQLSHRGLRCHVGTQAAFGRDTVRILGIGRRSPKWSAWNPSSSESRLNTCRFAAWHRNSRLMLIFGGRLGMIDGQNLHRAFLRF